MADDPAGHRASRLGAQHEGSAWLPVVWHFRVFGQNYLLSAVEWDGVQKAFTTQRLPPEVQ